MTTTLDLAGRLRTLPQAELVEALHGRPFRRQGVADFFDLAEALLDADSLDRTLQSLDRTRFAALIVLGRASGPLDAEALAREFAEHPATDALTAADTAAALKDLAARFLVHPAPGGYSAYDAVTARMQNARALADLAAPLLAAAPPVALAPVPDTEQRFTDRLAAERAFEAITTVSELLTTLNNEGARESQKGGLALPAAKRLAEALAVDAHTVPIALSVAARAGLAAVSDGMWLPTAAADDWSHASLADRWRVLAAGWRDALPTHLRMLLADRSRAVWGESLREHVAWLYPAAVDDAERRVAVHAHEAEWLGVTARHAPSSAGTALAEGDADAAAATLATLFPTQVDRVYLQHDLTVISPGPLDPTIEARLRTMADLESRALASTFRFSAASIDRAVTAGETATSIRDFLATISLTGVPQPVDYLIADAVERHGRVRVRQTPDGSVVRSADATLLRTIQVDQSLTALRWSRREADLVSRSPRDVVYWALIDARYPVVAEDETGLPLVLNRRRVARAAPEPASDPDADLVTRLRQADEHTGGGEAETTAEQWLARQLETAVRARQTVIVEVALPDGRTVEFLLEPTGVSGGRLRGRDRAADIERTLPLSSVTAIRMTEPRSVD